MPHEVLIPYVKFPRYLNHPNIWASAPGGWRNRTIIVLPLFECVACLFSDQRINFMAKNFNNMQFSPTKLDKREIERFKAQQHEIIDDMLELLIALTTDAYKVTISAHQDNGAFICTVIPRQGQKVNDGFMLSSWAGSPVEALAMSLWKHFVLYEGGAWPRPSDSDTMYG